MHILYIWKNVVWFWESELTPEKFVINASKVVIFVKLTKFSSFQMTVSSWILLKNKIGFLISYGKFCHNRRMITQNWCETKF